jgi:hypothetical protein
MKHVFVHAYTLRHHPRHAMSLWSPDKHVPQFTLNSPFPKITSANYSFSHTCIIVQLLFTKAAVDIRVASWYSTSIIAAYRQIDVSQPWSKARFRKETVTSKSTTVALAETCRQRHAYCATNWQETCCLSQPTRGGEREEGT